MEEGEDRLLSHLGQNPQDQPVYNAGGNPKDQHQAGNGEHLGADAKDKSFCCCQYRTPLNGKLLVGCNAEFPPL